MSTDTLNVAGIAVSPHHYIDGQRVASDMRSHTTQSATFDKAVELHELIAAIERSEGAAIRL